MTDDTRTSNQWNTPWRASGFAVYDTSGNLVAHTGITGNRSMHGKQLELMAAMIAEAVNAYSAGEPPGECSRCQGSGEVRAMTQEHGPDDYEFDAECPECKGVGVVSRTAQPPAESLKDLISDSCLCADGLCDACNRLIEAIGGRTPATKSERCDYNFGGGSGHCDLLAGHEGGHSHLTNEGRLRLTARPCTCHPDDNPPRPCPQKYALSECRRAAGEKSEDMPPGALAAQIDMARRSMEQWPQSVKDK